MTASRVRRFAVLAIIWLPSAAVAADRQDGLDATSFMMAQSGPVRLVPRERATPSPLPEDDLKQPALPPGSSLPTTPHRSIQNIEVNPLRGPDPDEAGSLYADNGGFGSALWDGMPRELIGRLVQRLPAAAQSPAMRDIVRRMLLTAASLPVRTDEGGPSLIVSRTERLQAMGLLGSAAELIAVAPNRDSDERLQKLRAENFLLRNDVGGACSESAKQVQRLSVLFWQQLLIYCQAVQGDTAGASLGANLLAETGQLNDPVFFALVDGLVSGNPTAVDSLSSPAPLSLSLMRTAGVPVPADSVVPATPPLLGMIGGSPNTPIETRLEAAERAALYGAMTADRLAEVYASVAFSTEDLDNALSIADVTRTPRGRALLYQAALVHSVPTARAAVIQKGLALAREDGRYALVVRVYETLLSGMAPTGELVWFAADASRALYALDRADLARQWLEALRREAYHDAESAAAAHALWAIATLAESGLETEASPQNMALKREPAEAPAAPLLQAQAPPAFGGVRQGVVTTLPVEALPEAVPPTTPEKPEPGFDTAGAAEWREALRVAVPEVAARRIADAYTLLAAAGVRIDADEWRAVLGEADHRVTISPDPAYRKMLGLASAQGRRGETILMAALILGEAGLAEMDMTVVAEVVTALRQVGLTQEARKFAIEIAVQAGL